MKPRYSVLFFKENLTDQKEKMIGSLLREGKKVFWFGTQDEAEVLRRKYESFAAAFFLQVFDIAEVRGQEKYAITTIQDGVGINDAYAVLFDWVEENVPAFNAAQYRVEHCQEDANIVVKASAGTGKTTVMVDRILYLMHMVPDLNMSEIYMITFTNEATNQMNDRLQEMLLKKYQLTKNQKYLTWLEQQSQMHISTIDSLAYDLFRKFGTSVGFGRDLDIQQLEKERKDLIRDLLSDQLNAQKSIYAQIGMTYAEAVSLIDNYWRELTRKGYTISEILNKDWGNADEQPVVSGFQMVLKNVLREFEGKYRQLKLDENAISINDLFFDFGHFLLDGKLNCDGLNMRYLFVDEFQDTDATQIRTFASLVQTVGARLFAVGDIKQSIYAFKGATDEAFDILEEELKGKLQYFSLRNNYRTCANLMKNMEKYFFAWAQEGLLDYEEPVRPFKKEKGSISMEFIESKYTILDQTMNAIDDALRDLEVEVRSGRKKVSDKTRVAVLVRSNAKAAQIAELCRKSGKTVVLSSDRPFFLSRAVRDFYALICSYIFADTPTYTYNFLLTPYAAFAGTISISEMEKRGNTKDGVQTYLKEFVSQTQWQKFQREFRLRPVLSVVKDIIEETAVVEKFIEIDKAGMNSGEWTEARRNKQALIDAKLYQKNLDKLMEMLQQRMEGEFATLYDLYVYLTLMISTNREEMEPDIDMTDDYSSVYIMTVHRSKGLEFDTVIMPAMNGPLIQQESTIIMANRSRIAWCYKRGNNDFMRSAWYKVLREEAVQKGIKEETRMLYVAMTRAVSKLVLLVNKWDYESWSSLIRRVGMINEK